MEKQKKSNVQSEKADNLTTDVGTFLHQTDLGIILAEPCEQALLFQGHHIVQSQASLEEKEKKKKTTLSAHA